MEELKKLVIQLGYTYAVVNDKLYLETPEGLVLFQPLGLHALEIEDLFSIDTYYSGMEWIAKGLMCGYSAPTAPQARLNAALSYLEK